MYHDIVNVSKKMNHGRYLVLGPGLRKKRIALFLITSLIFLVVNAFHRMGDNWKYRHGAQYAEKGRKRGSIPKRPIFEMVQVVPSEVLGIPDKGGTGRSIQTAAKQLKWAVTAAQQGEGNRAVSNFKKAMVSAGDGARPDVRKCNQVLKYLGDHRLLKEAKEVYDAMVEAKIRMTVVTFCTLISRTGAAGRADYAQFYYREMLSQGIKPDVQVINSLINAYSKVNQVDKVFQLLGDIIKQGLEPTVVTFNSVCEACCRANNLDKARRVVAYMRKRNMTPNERTLSILINGLAKAGQIEEALEVFRGMKEEDGPLANEFIYAALINACGKSEKLGTALDLYREMRFERKLTPNVVVWTALMDACTRGKQLSIAFSLLKEMMSCGVAPNEVTLSILFNGCLKEREIEMAFQVLDLMKEEGMDMQVAYTCLLSESTKMDNEKAGLEILHGLATNKTHQKEVARQENVGTDMLHVLAKTKELDKAFEVFETMAETHMLPSERALQDVFKAVNSAKELDKSMEMFGTMRKQGKSVNEVTYIALLGACGRADRLLKGFDLLEDMKSSGQQPSEKFYRSLMEICQASNDPNAVFNVFEDMENAGVQPGLQSFTSLLKAITNDQQTQSTNYQQEPYLEKGSLPDEKEHNALEYSHPNPSDNLFRVFLVFQEMRSRGISPDRPAYNCILSACSRAGDLDKAWNVYQQMIEDGISLDAISYTNLIKVCGVCGEINQAEDIFQTMQQRTNHFSTYVKPTGVTYATIMQANNKAQRHGRVLELYDEMLYNRISPSLYGYREALKASYNLKDKDRAMEIYGRMKKKGIRLDNQCLLFIVKLLDAQGEHQLSRRVREERSMMVDSQRKNNKF